MKILKLLFLILLIIQVTSFAQVTQEWVAFCHRDASKGNTLGIDSSGNVIISGTSGYDWITIKYSANGDTLWEQLLESPIQQPNQNYEMALDPWGNAVVVGTAYHDSTWEKHWCVAKYNSIDGHEEWIEYMFHPYQKIDDDALDVAIDSSGRATVAGVIFNGSYISQGTGFDWIVKSYTSSGGTHWFDQFDHGTTGDAARRVVCTNTGITYVCGTSQDTTRTFYQVKVHKYNYYGPDWDKHINVIWDEPQPQIAIDKNQNVFIAYDDGTKFTSNEIILIKYDSLGTLQWQKTISTPGSFDNYVVDIKTDSEGDVVFACIYKDESRYFHCQTVKYSADGDSLWTLTEGEGTYPHALVIDAENNIYVGGKIPEMVVKYDPDGNEIWREGYLSATARDIGVDDQGNIFVTGYYSSDIITIKYSQVVGVNDPDLFLQPRKFELGQNYPNPFNPSTKIKYSIPSSVIAFPRNDNTSVTLSGVEESYVILKVYDILGREVAALVNEQQQSGNYEVSFHASNLSSGVYYYQLKSGSFIETKKMILLR